MIREISISLASAVIIGVAGYILVVKENQKDIEYLKLSVVELKQKVEAMGDIAQLKQFLQEVRAEAKSQQSALVSTKLFIAQAHPDRSMGGLVSSYRKLRALNDEEITALASSVSFLDVSNDRVLLSDMAKESNPELINILKEHEIDENDLKNYKKWAVQDDIAVPGFH